MKRMALLAVFAMMLAALVACGGSSTTTSAPTNYAVTMSGVTFNMNTISVPKGSTITFTTTQGGAAHNLVIGSSGRSHPESGTPDFGTGGHTVGSGQSYQPSLEYRRHVSCHLYLPPDHDDTDCDRDRVTGIGTHPARATCLNVASQRCAPCVLPVAFLPGQSKIPGRSVSCPAVRCSRSLSLL
jgi:plastocyanin